VTTVERRDNVARNLNAAFAQNRTRALDQGHAPPRSEQRPCGFCGGFLGGSLGGFFLGVFFFFLDTPPSTEQNSCLHGSMGCEKAETHCGDRNQHTRDRGPQTPAKAHCRTRRPLGARLINAALEAPSSPPPPPHPPPPPCPTLNEC